VDQPAGDSDPHRALGRARGRERVWAACR